MITISAPYIAATRTISLRDPELGDANTISQKVKFDKAMDGTIYSYNNTPVNQKFTWHFIELTISKAQELQDFILATQGLDLALIDFNLNPFKVRCLTTMLVLTTTSVGVGTTARKESVSTDLQFEVVP